MAIDVHAEMTSRVFLMDLSVRCRLSIVNSGSDEQTVADPILNEVNPEYILRLPDGSSRTLTLGNARPREPWTDPMAPPCTATMPLAPRSKWEEEIPLDPMFAFSQPGRYSLEIALLHDGKRILTPSMPFEVQNANVTAFAAVPQGPNGDEGRLSTAWVHSGSGRLALVDAVRIERRWAHPRLSRLYSHVVYESGQADVTQIAVPAMHAERGMDFANWLVWIEGHTLWALPTEAGRRLGTNAATVMESRGTLTLVKDPVMTGGHDLVVFALEENDGKAALLRLDVSRTAPLSGRLSYRVPLESTPDAIRAIHYRTRAGERTSIFWIESSAQQTSIFRLGDGSSPEPVRLADFRDARPLPGSPLWAYRLNGAATIAACVLRPNVGDTIRIGQVTLADDGSHSAKDRQFEVRVPEGAKLLRSSMALSKRGAHLVWRDESGAMFYAASGAAPVAVSGFRPDPFPALLPGDAKMFVAGVRHDGAFAIEEAAVAISSGGKP